MTFTTLTFLVFLAVVFALYWLSGRRRAQNALLILASYCFYGWWDYRFCGLMFVSSLVDYVVGQGLKRTERRRYRVLLLLASLFCNLGLLGFFKYYNFFADNLRRLAITMGWRLSPFTLRVVLPVGISFYTFQTLSYTIDVYRRKLQPCDSAIDFFAFVCFFPQLVAGPIERARNLLSQFASRRRFDYDRAVDGCRQILWGLFKKMVLADRIALVVEQCYANPAAASGPELALGTVCFAYQIYFDFSAYSDIAIGAARMFGFDLMRNFALPYFSRSIPEFWRRWHISLSTWFRDYVYIPLGGSRAGRARVMANVLVTFLISGFWHGAAWKFVVWGGINGLGVMVSSLLPQKHKVLSTDTPGGEHFLPRPLTLLKMLGTFAFICAAWAFFRAADVPQALLILKKIAVEAFRADGYRACAALISPKFNALFYWLGACVLLEWARRREAHPLAMKTLPEPLRWCVYTLFVFAVLGWGATIEESGEFIYFQF